MDAKNLDSFLCNKCGEWYHYIDTFEEHNMDDCDGPFKFFYKKDALEIEKQRARNQANLKMVLESKRKNEAIGKKLATRQPSSSCVNLLESNSGPDFGRKRTTEVPTNDPPKSTDGNEKDPMDDDANPRVYILVCGKCHGVFNYIDEFKNHRSTGICLHKLN